MDNQKFRLNLTIYHTNGAVLSPTSIVFSGARLERLQKALALLTEAADRLWSPNEASEDDAAAQSVRPALPAETAAAEEPEAEPKRPANKVKGLLLVKCPECHGRFTTVARDWVSEMGCSCGNKIKLGKDNTARFEFTCKACNSLNYGRTNIDESYIPAGSISCFCGAPGPELVWRPDIREYREKEGT